MANLELRLDGHTVAKVEIDTDLLRRLIGVAAPARNGAAEAPHKSAALTTPQARDLLKHAGKPMADFLSRLVEEHGAITWGEAKQTFDVRTFAEFAEGPLKKLEKSVHRLGGEHNSPLIWRVEHEWIGLEKGEDEVCRLHIDGPALEALREAMA